MKNVKYLINPKFDAFRDFIQTLPEVFDREGELIYDGRNQVRVFVRQGQKLVVKRFKRPLFHQRIDYTFFRPSKARRAYDFGRKLLELGLDTPEPIACIEVSSGGLFLQGYFISTFCGDPDARIIREEPDAHDRLIDALAHYLAEMHRKGFLHGDTNLSNFLYHADDSQWGYHITTIDVNRSHFRENLTREECLESLFRLTHVRPALKKIVARYAAIQGWDAEESVRLVLRRLQSFEHRKELKHRFLP